MDQPRRTWLIIGVMISGLLGVVVLGVVAYGRLFPDPTKNSVAFTEQITSRAGYVDVSINKNGGASCYCVQRWYIGPAGLDPAEVFTGPNLAWTPVREPLKNGWQPLADAVGSTPDTGDCRVEVARERPEYAQGLEGAIKLPPGQADAWRAGTLDVLELYVACERDSGSA